MLIHRNYRWMLWFGYTGIRKIRCYCTHVLYILPLFNPYGMTQPIFYSIECHLCQSIYCLMMPSLHHQLMPPNQCLYTGFVRIYWGIGHMTCMHIRFHHRRPHCHRCTQCNTPPFRILNNLCTQICNGQPRPNQYCPATADGKCRVRQHNY